MKTETDRERRERLLGIRRFELNQDRFRAFHVAVDDFGKRRQLQPFRGWPRPTVGAFGLTDRKLRSLYVNGRDWPGPELPHLDHWAAFTKAGRLAAAISWPYADPIDVAYDLDTVLPDRMVWAVVAEGPTCSVYPTSPIAYCVVDSEVVGSRWAELHVRAFTSTTKWSLPVAARQWEMAEEMRTLYPPTLRLVA